MKRRRIEILTYGTMVMVAGDTYEARDILKSFAFTWSRRYHAWVGIFRSLMIAEEIADYLVHIFKDSGYTVMCNGVPK